MTPHKQLLRHDPDNGVLGDCYRTVIACLLDLYPDQVPHFFGDADMSDADVRALMKEWLGERGLTSFTIAFGGSDLDVILNFMRVHNPDVYYMLSGASPRGTHHVCIFKEDAMVWDPHPDEGGVVEPTNGVWWIELLVPSFMRAAPAETEGQAA